MNRDPKLRGDSPEKGEAFTSWECNVAHEAGWKTWDICPRCAVYIGAHSKKLLPPARDRDVVMAALDAAMVAFNDAVVFDFVSVTQTPEQVELMRKWAAQTKAVPGAIFVSIPRHSKDIV